MGKLYNFDGGCYGLRRKGEATTDGTWGSYTILMVVAMDCEGKWGLQLRIGVGGSVKADEWSVGKLYNFDNDCYD